MKCLYSILILTLLIQSNLKAQNLIAVQNGGAPAFYTVLQTAVDNAQSGDTIYIPGGIFDDITVNKKLNLIGAGSHPDSANVTSRTVIRSITILSGADNGSLTGVYFPWNHSDTWGTTPNLNIGQIINGYSISRCYLPGYHDVAETQNIVFNENIIGDLSCSGVNISMNNNIVLRSIYVSKSLIQNNIFLGNYSTGSCTFVNNIFNTYVPSQLNHSICYNNVNNGCNGVYPEYLIQGSGNYLDGVTLQSVFVNYDPSAISGDGIYKADFHLKTDSPYKNAGTDGTDIGIYGGAFPWKAGSIPFNPHFQILKIAPKTDNNGNLNVQIKIGSQDH